MNDQQQRNPLFGRGKAQGANAQMCTAKSLAGMSQLGVKPAFAGVSAASASVPASAGSASVKLAVGQTPATAAAATGVASPATAVAAKPQVKRDSTLEVMVASMVGTAIEFYDNYCYSIAAASYFGLIFFTDVAKSDPVLATLLAFVTFAVSFLARPFGSLLLGGQNAAMVVNFGIPSAPNLSPRARSSFKQVCPAFAILRASPP